MAMRLSVLTVVAFLAGASLHADEAEDKAVAAAKKLGGIAKRDGDAPGKPAVEATPTRRIHRGSGPE